MVAPALTFGSGPFLYSLTITLNLLAGLGLLRLIRLPLRSFPAVFLAPVLTLAFWSDRPGPGCGPRSPGAAPWPSSSGRAHPPQAGSLRRPRGPQAWSDRTRPARHRRRGWAAGPGPLRTAAGGRAVPLLPVRPGGIPGQHLSRRQVLRRQRATPVGVFARGRGAGGGLPPALPVRDPSRQHAVHLRRFMLGYFSPLIQSGDTEAAQGLFITWSLFVFASSRAFFLVFPSVCGRFCWSRTWC